MKQRITKSNKHSKTAASAVTVGALFSVAIPADAAIQYFDNGGSGWQISTASGKKTISIGLASIQMYVNATTGGPTLCYLSLLRGNATFIGTDPQIARLAYSDNIAAGANFNLAAQLLNHTDGGPVSGNFQDGNTGYIGFRFESSGTKYGWIHVDDIEYGPATSFSISGYAYEDSGASIKAGDQGGGAGAAPEPSGLALLACGAAGIYALRRKCRP